VKGKNTDAVVVVSMRRKECDSVESVKEGRRVEGGKVEDQIWK